MLVIRSRFRDTVPPRPAILTLALLTLTLLAGLVACSGSAQPPRSAPAAPATGRAPGAEDTPAGAASSSAGRHPASPRPTSPLTSAPAMPAPAPKPSVTVWNVANPDGTQVTIARFPRGFRFALHAGYEDPGPLGFAAGPGVTAAERPKLVAAFNGGFKLSTGAGGYQQEGRVLNGLRPGLASLVIDVLGHAEVGVWGVDVPRPGEQVRSVRQNLMPLVQRGGFSPSVDDIGNWGATLGGGSDVARSALAEDGSGNLLYAGSMYATPRDLAAALIRAGARTGMELDINPQWVQLAVALVPGGALVAGVPGQHRPATQFLTGWSRDFVTVLAP